MANYAKAKVRPNSKIKVTQKGAINNRVVLAVPRNTKIKVKKS